MKTGNQTIIFDCYDSIQFGYVKLCYLYELFPFWPFHTFAMQAAPSHVILL